MDTICKTNQASKDKAFDSSASGTNIHGKVVRGPREERLSTGKGVAD